MKLITDLLATVIAVMLLLLLIAAVIWDYGITAGRGGAMNLVLSVLEDVTRA